MFDWIIAAGMITLYLAFASSRFVDRLRAFAWCRRRASYLVLALAIPFLLLGWGQGADLTTLVDELGGLLLYLTVPALLLLAHAQGRQRRALLDAGAIILLWMPIEFDWLPDRALRLGEDVSLPATMLTAILMALLSFHVLRPLPKIGYTFNISWVDLRRAGQALLAYTIIGVPLGLATKFLLFDPAPFAPVEWAASLLLGYVLVALPEELLFRGIMQQLIGRWLPGPWQSLLVTSLIFGLAHLNNATTGYPAPNWMYAIMATLAGLAYGWTWQRTGKITVSALVHASVNLVWGILLG